MSSEMNGGYVSAKEFAELRTLLLDQTAIVTGGRDRHGGPILTIPQNSSALVDKAHLENFKRVVTFIASFPSEEVRRHGFTFVIDMRSSSWTNVKNVLRALQDGFPFAITCAFVIKSETEKIKSKSSQSSSKYGFEVVVIDVDQLPLHINTSQLTRDLRGTLNYDHGKWVEARSQLNFFSIEARRKLSEMNACKKDIQSLELTEKLEVAESMRLQLNQWRTELVRQQAELDKLEERGRVILQHLGPRAPGVYSAPASEAWRLIAENPDFHAHIDAVRLMVDQIHSVPEELNRALQIREERLTNCREFCAFQERAKEKQIWIRKVRQLFVANYAHIGNSQQDAEALQLQHTNFYEGCMTEFLDIDRLLELGTRLLGTGHYASQKIKFICDTLDSQKNALVSGLKDRSTVLTLAVRFYQKAEEFAASTPMWMEQCDIDKNLPSKTAALGKLRDQHLALTTTINQAFSEMRKCGTELLQHVEELVLYSMRVFADHCREDAKTVLYAMSGSSSGQQTEILVPSPHDAEKLVAHLSAVVHKLHASHKELQRRCKIKNIILSQHLDLRTMQEHAKIIINWIETHGMPFLHKGDIGRSSNSARALRQKHQKFEEVIEKTYANTEATLQSADRLLECDPSELYFEVLEVQSSRQALEHCVTEFRKKVASRACMLDSAVAFYDHLASLMGAIEDSKRNLQSEPSLDTLESVIEAVNRHNVERQQVMDCWTHTETEGHALQLQLKSYSNPVSADYEHIQNLLQKARILREEVELAWTPRRNQLELFSKLRMFERSTLENVDEIERWIQSMQVIDNEIDLESAKKILENLDSTILSFQTNNFEAFKRGEDLLEYLRDKDLADIVDVAVMESRVISNMEKLEEVQNALLDESEFFKMRLESKIEARLCERRAESIIHSIKARTDALLSFPVALGSPQEASMLLRKYEEIHRDVETLQRKVLPEFLDLADTIAHHDIEESEAAVRAIESVKRYFNELLPLSEDMCSAISNALTFYKAVDQVCAVLDPLEREYSIEEDLYASARLHGEDPGKWIESRLHRHQEQRKCILKHCTYVRRSGELFMKHLIRAFPATPAKEADLRHVKNQITARRDHIDRLESSVLEHWSVRKRRFEECREYIFVEGFARRYLAWINEKSERYLDVRRLSGSDHTSVESLWNEHKKFQQDAKEHQDKLKVFKRLLDDLHPSHSHKQQIESWRFAVESAQRDFQARLDNYQRSLETKLGCLANGQKNLAGDRNSDGNLEVHIQEMALVSEEEKRKERQRGYIMKELIDTEQVYVKDLADCIKYYFDEMLSPSTGILLPQDLGASTTVIFGNIREIYAFHSEIFLKELEKYKSVPEDLGHCFVTWTPKFDAYVTYCTNMDQQHSRAIVASQTAKDYFKEVQNYHKLGLEIGAYLIKPVQRIVKYGQLLEELLKCSDDDSGEIQEGLEVMKSVPKKANDAIKLKCLEGFNQPLEPLGELLLVNAFQVWDKNGVGKIGWKSQERHAFLFEFAILLAKQTGDAKYPRFAFKDKILMTGLGISEHVENDECKFMIWLSRTSQSSQSVPSASDSKIVFKAQSADVKQSWVCKLREVARHNYVNTSLNAALISVSKASSQHRANRISRDSKDYDDSLSLEEGSGSHDRCSVRDSTISHSSSATTDSDRQILEGDCATVIADHQAANDAELSVEKGDLVEVLDRTSSGDCCLVRLKNPSTKSATLSVRPLEGYVPVTILALSPGNQLARTLSPSRPISMESGSAHDGFGSSSTASLPVISQSASGSSTLSGSGDATPTNVITAQPSSKRRTTFKKWLTNPVRKLSQNRIDAGSSSSTASTAPTKQPVQPASLALPTGNGTNSNSTGKKAPTSLPTQSSAPGSSTSRMKSLFHSQNQSATVASSSSPPDSDRRSTAPPLAQQEDLHPDEENSGHKSTTISITPAASVDLVASSSGNDANEALSDGSSAQPTAMADLPPEMQPLDFQAVQEAPSLSYPRSPSHSSVPTDNILSRTESIHSPTRSGGGGESESLVPSQSPAMSANASNPCSNTLASPQRPASEQESSPVTSAGSPSSASPLAPMTESSARNNENPAEEQNGNNAEENAAPEKMVDPVTKAITMRDYVIRELVETERDYVKDLGLICEGYVSCMHENPPPEDMNGREKIIFGNVHQIYVFHRDTFCGELEKCLEAADRLPQVFIRFERRFQMYVVYCQNKPKSEFIVSEYIDTYFEDIRLKLGQKLKLPDMLIKPVQRVMRYQLMLKDILKYTERAQLPAAELQKAIKCIMGVCKLANDFMEVGRLQGFDQNLNAQGKLLLQEGFLVCETSSGSSNQGKEKEKDKDNQLQNNKFKERHIFLFEQVVIFAEALGSSGHKKSYGSPVYIYKNHIQVNKMSLIEVEKDHVRFALRSRCPHTGDRMFVIEAPDQEKRDLWVAQIKDMLDTQQNFLRALQSPIDFQRRAQQGDDLSSTPFEEDHLIMRTAPPDHGSYSTQLSEIIQKRPSQKGEKKFTRFLRPKSYAEDRRRTLTAQLDTDAVQSQRSSVMYSGSLTAPFSPKELAEQRGSFRHAATAEISAESTKFLFPPPTMKVVQSETDLLNKKPPSAGSSPATKSRAESKSSLEVLDDQSTSSGRRWSISGRREKEKPPRAAANQAKEPKSSLSFRRKD